MIEAETLVTLLCQWAAQTKETFAEATQGNE